MIDMNSTDSMWGSLHFLSPSLTALTDEFNKRGTICLAKNRAAELSVALLATVSAVLMNISQCVQSEGTNHSPAFLFL